MSTALIDLDSLIKKADELQPLPASTTKLVSLVSGGEGDVNQITDIVSLDPALTVRVLRSANSAFSGAVRPITTVKEAVSRLGTRRVLSLAVASHTRPMMKTSVEAYGLNEGQLWRHSVVCLLAAEIANRVCKTAIPPASITAALLHDIGKLVMACFLNREILDLLERAKSEGKVSPLEAETQILQVHHGELGGLIARHWKLPETIATGITYHHNPADGGDIICDVVHLANVVAKHVEAELDGKKSEAAVNPDSAERLGLAPDGVDRLRADTLTSFQKVGALYGVA